jgi:hypothetical protein
LEGSIPSPLRWAGLQGFLAIFGVRRPRSLRRNLEWYADFETVVVDNGSTDGSYELCERALEQGTIAALRRPPTERHDIERLMRAVFRARDQTAT